MCVSIFGCCKSARICVRLCVYHLIFTTFKRKPKTAITLKKKRKRYRDKKKKLLKQVTNFGHIFSPVEDTSENNKYNILEDKLVTDDTINHEIIETNIVDGSTTTSWFYLEPDNEMDSEHQWDEKDLKLLKHQVENKEKDKSLYDGYIDMDPCFPRECRTCGLNLPKYMKPLDKISINSKFLELHYKMEGIKEIARNYRDKCKELKIDVARVKAKNAQIEADALVQKQKTRYFWRNQILEGSTRSGRIVRNALKLNCK